MDFKGHTRGPWYWDVRKRTKTFRLVSPYGGQMIVMDFARWGMQGAQPRFSDRNGVMRGGIMEDGSSLDLSSNPDACLIAAAPEILRERDELLAAAGNLIAWVDDPDPAKVRNEQELFDALRAAVRNVTG